MKKYLVILLILLILTSSLSGFTVVTPYEGASNLMKYGFITGHNGDPMVDKVLTRAEVAVIMAELNGVKESAAYFALPSGFSDVSQDKWYSPYIAYGRAYKFLGGYPDGTFRPDSPVNAQEFAAFMMNAMGYNGSYTFDQVIGFAAGKDVIVKARGSQFVRGDAFEAMWDVVNQPAKGSEIVIGEKLGKFATAIQPVAPTNLVHEVVASSGKSFEVRFNSSVKEPSRFTFTVNRVTAITPVNISLAVAWNESKTVARLVSNIPLDTGDYEITVNDATSGAPKPYGPYKTKIEREKITRVVLDSDVINLHNHYTGTIGYRAYNQYDEEVTNTNLGRSMVFTTTTDTPKPTVEFTSGIITVQHGTVAQASGTLKDLPHVVLIITEPTSSFSFSKSLKISDFNTGISEVRINGIINEYGNQVEFTYDLTKQYYLDVVILDSAGRVLKDRSVLDTVGVGGVDLIMVRSSNEGLATLTKVPHPLRSNEMAFKITLVSDPGIDSYVLFTVLAPHSVTGKNTASFMATLKR